MRFLPRGCDPAGRGIIPTGEAGRRSGEEQRRGGEAGRRSGGEQGRGGEAAGEVGAVLLSHITAISLISSLTGGTKLLLSSGRCFFRGNAVSPISDKLPDFCFGWRMLSSSIIKIALGDKAARPPLEDAPCWAIDARWEIGARRPSL